MPAEEDSGPLLAPTTPVHLAVPGLQRQEGPHRLPQRQQHCAGYGAPEPQ